MKRILGMLFIFILILQTDMFFASGFARDTNSIEKIGEGSVEHYSPSSMSQSSGMTTLIPATSLATSTPPFVNSESFHVGQGNASGLDSPSQTSPEASSTTNVLAVQPLSSSNILFTESFEGSFPSTNWNVGDDDANNGNDYWDDVAHRTYSGSWSGWCAAIGTKTDGTPNTNTWTYDNYMKAYMSRKTAFDARSWDIAFLTYRTWYNTESGYDHLDLSVTGDGSNWREIFQYKDNSLSDSNGDWELSGNSGGYQYRVARIPETTSAGSIYTSSFNIGYYFQSDSTIGPGTYEGAYLDEIAFTTYDISFDAVSRSTASANPGDTIQLGYNIDNLSPFTLKVWLGATLTSPSGSQINDAAHDALVTVPGNTHQYYYRLFTIPSGAAPGAYDVTYAIWSGFTSPISSSRQWYSYTWNDAVNVQAFDFSIQASPPSQTIPRGSSTTYSVSVYLASGLTKQVSLSLSGLPSGASYSFSPQNGYPYFTSTLTVYTSSSTPTGTSTLTITGSGDGKTRSTTVQLMVQPGTIAVSGRFVFVESDGSTQRSVRYAKVQLCDSDLGGAIISVLSEVETASDGTYVFPSITNDDGALEGGYDIFVKVFADSFCAIVTNDPLVGPTTYRFQTPQFDNVNDGSFNMGTRAVSDPGAWCIYDTLILGYQFATTLNPVHFHPKVTGCWPSSGLTYTEVGNPNRMHFVAGDSWDEDVILHEYGHSVQHNVYGEWIPSASGIHDWNQHTNPNFAFSEGWATFFGVLAAKEKGYGDSLFPKDSHYHDTVDQSIDTDLETDVHTMGDDVEATTACILWDLYDSSDDGRDTLSAGVTPIWDVFKNYIVSSHHCYTIREFWDGWMSRGHDNQQQLWGIYYDHGVNQDTSAPANPTAFSCTHSQNAWSSSTSVTISWSGATDDLSGVNGYSYHWVTTPSLPNNSPDAAGPFTTTLGGGDWYFCIRTRDNAGNWNTGYSQYGPIRIDTTNPTYSGQSPTDGTRYDNDLTAITLQIIWTDAQSSISTVWFRYKYDALSWTSWLSPSGSSGNTYWLDIPSSEWRNYVGNKLYWESHAINGASSTIFTTTFTGPDILDDDTSGPNLSNPISAGNIDDSLSGNYRIQIDATDPSGISTLDFSYRFGAGSWSSWMPHSGLSGSTYWYSIPYSEWILHVGETVYFKIVAFDNDNDRGTADRAYTNSQDYTAGTISDDDTTPPTLANPTCTLDPTNSYKLQIIVTDPSQVYQVRFRYNFDAGTWTDWYSPSGTAGDTYWHLIPEAEWTGHATLYWEVFAEDNDNDRTNDHTSITSSTFQCNIGGTNQPPSITDIYPNKNSEYKGGTIRLYCDSQDDKTLESALACKIWLRPAGSTWIISEQTMLWDGTNHYYDWVIPPSATLGYYDVRCSVSDGELASERTDYNEFQVLEQFEFNIVASPPSRTITAGSSTTYDITVTLVSGITQLVSLSCLGTPPGLSPSLSQATGYPTFTATLTINTIASTTPGTYTITITGTGPCTHGSHSTTVQLVVKTTDLPFDDGFESGSFSNWAGKSNTTGETATVANSLSHHGTYSALSMSNGNGGTERAYCYKTLSSATELYARGYFFVSASGIVANDNRFYFLIFKAGSQSVAFAGWRMTGGVVKWTLLIRHGTSWVSVYSTTSPLLNQWYCVELHWKKDATNGLGELWINGVLVCSVSDRNTANYGDVNRVEFGLPELVNCAPTIVYGDSCVVSKARIAPPIAYQFTNDILTSETKRVRPQ